LLAGCNLYFGGDDQPPPCEGDYAGPNIPAQELRDPSTGQCETFGYGGCDPTNTCGCTPIEVPAMPNWPVCGGACDSLDESDCLNTTGCHAEYTGTACPPNADCTTTTGITFWTCGGTEQPTAEGGDCWSLSAESCQQHDDCASTYLGGDTGSASFNQCIPEPGVVAQCTLPCAYGTHCEVTCPPCTDPNGACPQYCVETCEPDATTGPGDCTGSITCNDAPPKCPQNTTAGIANGCWTGYCIPDAACGKPDPGVCNGPVECALAQPACPAGTEPGAANGCWTGYCIPDADCPPTPTTCASITDEKTCVSRTDCEAVYDGMGCTCDANGCTCTSETFARCEDAGKL
jgi:hypothetical protein